MNFLRMIVVLSAAVMLASSSPIRSVLEEREDLFEGDIAGIPRDERGAFQIPTSSRGLWPNGKITYMIDSKSAYSETELNNIASGLKNIEDSTRVDGQKIIEFIQVPDDTPASNLPDQYIRIFRENGCWSYVGRSINVKGAQNLSLGDGCATLGITAHEFLHALGWWHEQSRTDRDDHVKINYENIRPGTEHNFNKYSSSQVGLLDFPYDYDSVMHYSATSFSVNGLPTIEPIVPGAVIGQRRGLSSQDAVEIIQIYGPKKSNN